MPLSGELDQLRQASKVGVVFFVNVLADLRHSRLRRDLFEGVVMFSSVCEGGTGIFQQIGFRAALLIVGVHHHARGRTAQVDTRLQHQIPRRGEFTLLQAKIVRGGETVWFCLMTRKKPAGDKLK